MPSVWRLPNSSLARSARARPSPASDRPSRNSARSVRSARAAAILDLGHPLAVAGHAFLIEQYASPRGHRRRQRGRARGIHRIEGRIAGRGGAALCGDWPGSSAASRALRSRSQPIAALGVRQRLGWRRRALRRSPDRGGPVSAETASPPRDRHARGGSSDHAGNDATDLRALRASLSSRPRAPVALTTLYARRVLGARTTALGRLAGFRRLLAFEGGGGLDRAWDRHAAAVDLPLPRRRSGRRRPTRR